MDKLVCDHQTANIRVARVIPCVLIAIVVYISYVTIGPLCVNYLLYPASSDGVSPRQGVAVVVMTLWATLLVPMATAFFQLGITILRNPGLVPRGSQWFQMHQPQHPAADGRRPPSDDDQSGHVKEKLKQDEELGIADPLSARRPVQAEQRPTTAGLEAFYTKDVFVCQKDGLPIWCSTCLNWKPDRAHHCSEIGRCVRKMDHFCPWVGGIVSETSFKFFLQFVTYAALFCLFMLVIMAYFVAERTRMGHAVNVHWIVTLCLAAFFELFTLGMTASSVQLTLRNLSTIENISRKTKVWQLAVYVPDPEQIQGAFSSSRPALAMRSFSVVDPVSLAPTGSRTFAILSSRPGDHPWDLGAWRNWKSVMGERVIDWILPLRPSPCSRHDSPESMFSLGPVIDRLRRENGLVAEESKEAGKGTRKQRAGSHSHERDDQGLGEADDAVRSRRKRHRTKHQHGEDRSSLHPEAV